MFRTEESLQEGVEKITEVQKRFANVGVKDRSMIFNTDLVETLELQNLLTCATVTLLLPNANPFSVLREAYVASKLLFPRLQGRNLGERTQGKIFPNEMIRIG